MDEAAILASDGQTVNSILVADCGSSLTRVSLLEQTEAGYCFVAHAVAPTTAEPPWSDVSLGVRQAMEQIAAASGRTLVDEHGFLLIPETDRNGVDLFVLTASAAQPLQVVLAGLVSQVSLASLQRAAAGAYTDVLAVVARDQEVARPQLAQTDTALTDEDQIALVRQHHPDLVVVVGGTDGGAQGPVHDLVENLALACTLVDRSPKPTLVFAGNVKLRSDVVEMVGGEIELEVIDNVRPTLDAENLASVQTFLQSVYVQRKVQRLPGAGTLIGWSEAPVLPTAQAMANLVMYLGRLYESGKGVLCADVGSAATTIIASLPPPASGSGDGAVEQASASAPMLPSLSIGPNLGVGYAAPALLERVGVERIARWLPFEPEPGEIEGVLLNKGVRPLTIPVERRELLIEQAAAREALRLVMDMARRQWSADRYWFTPPLEPIIATGGVLGYAPLPAQTVLMLLDTIEPVGVTSIVRDEHGMAAALGAVAVTQPLAAVQTLDNGAFRPLGTVIAPIGRARPGDVIMRTRVTFERGGELELEVKYGSIEVLPLSADETATLELQPRRGFRTGHGGGPITVHGGEVGLIIDARGRPLRLPSDPEACRRQMQKWFWDMGT